MFTKVICLIHVYFTKFYKNWNTKIYVTITQYRPIVVTYEDYSHHQYHLLQLLDDVAR